MISVNGGAKQKFWIPCESEANYHSLFYFVNNEIINNLYFSIELHDVDLSNNQARMREILVPTSITANEKERRMHAWEVRPDVFAVVPHVRAKFEEKGSRRFVMIDRTTNETKTHVVPLTDHKNSF